MAGFMLRLPLARVALFVEPRLLVEARVELGIDAKNT
jgi:hypothetical protein